MSGFTQDDRLALETAELVEKYGNVTVIRKRRYDLYLDMRNNMSKKSGITEERRKSWIAAIDRKLAECAASPDRGGFATIHRYGKNEAV